MCVQGFRRKETKISKVQSDGYSELHLTLSDNDVYHFSVVMNACTERLKGLGRVVAFLEINNKKRKK